jgi:hypothetical protein
MISAKLRKPCRVNFIFIPWNIIKIESLIVLGLMLIRIRVVKLYSKYHVKFKEMLWNRLNSSLAGETKFDKQKRINQYISDGSAGKRDQFMRGHYESFTVAGMKCASD